VKAINDRWEDKVDASHNTAPTITTDMAQCACNAQTSSSLCRATVAEMGISHTSLQNNWESGRYVQNKFHVY